MPFKTSDGSSSGESVDFSAGGGDDPYVEAERVRDATPSPSAPPQRFDPPQRRNRTVDVHDVPLEPKESSPSQQKRSRGRKRARSHSSAPSQQKRSKGRKRARSHSSRQRRPLLSRLRSRSPLRARRKLRSNARGVDDVTVDSGTLPRHGSLHSLPQDVGTVPPAIPMFHSVMMGVVKAVTQRGAFMQLSDGGPIPYLKGLLRRRKNTDDLRAAEKRYVKVVRIEAGMVIVDDRNVNQKTGDDEDPFHECAEVEDWIDIPSDQVGRVIGKGGAQIRQICQDTGADLRFDEAPVKGVGPPAVHGSLADAAVARRRPGLGTGSDLLHFLQTAKADDDGSAHAEEHADGADLRRFMDEAMRGSKPKAKDGDDLAHFLAEARDDGGAEKREEKAEDHSDCGHKQIAVEFVARNLENWVDLLYEKMGAAGVSLVYPENLSITDARGGCIDIARSLKQADFPIKVKYLLPPAEVSLKDRPAVPVQEAKHLATKSTSEAVDLQSLKLERGEGKDVAGTRADRSDAIHVSGVVRSLTRCHFEEILEAKNLPSLTAIEHLTKDEVLCIFNSSMDAEIALAGLKSEWDDEPDRKEGPGLWRARRGQLTFRSAKEAGIEAADPPPPQEFNRLRINGDAGEVMRAKVAVSKLLSTHNQQRRGAPGAGIRQLPGDARATMLVPLESIGRLIGRGGQSIRNLQEEFGVRLRLQPCQGGTEIGEGDQELLIFGHQESVDKVQSRIHKIIEDVTWKSQRASGVPQRQVESQQQVRAPRSPQASGVPTRQRASPEPRQRDPRPPQASGVPKRQRASPEPRPHHELTFLEDEQTPVRSSRHLSIESRKFAQTRGDTRSQAREESCSRSSSTSSRSTTKPYRQRKLELELQEYQVYLKKQQQLDRAAQMAEAEAKEALAFADGNTESTKGAHSGQIENAYADWKEDLGPTALLGKAALTPYGAGRVSRTVCTQDGDRFLTVRLLAGGTVQAPEQAVLSWLRCIEVRLGTCVKPPPEGPPIIAGSSVMLARKAQEQWAALQASGAGLVVADALNRGTRFAYRLVSIATPLVHLVDTDEIDAWPVADTCIYLVQLCTSPQTVGHIAPFRHDYRKSRELFKKGDEVIIEGMKPGVQDVGTVCKVLSGPKAEIFAANLPEAHGIPNLMKRVLWRCSAHERERRNNQAVTLEKTVLPLLCARLPLGAEALGVGASLDGTCLRLFVHLDKASPQTTDSMDAHGRSALAAKVAAVAGALAALLGCETELLAGKAPPSPPSKPAAQDVHTRIASADAQKNGDFEPSVQDPVGKKVMKKAKEKKKKKKKKKKDKIKMASKSTKENADKGLQTSTKKQTARQAQQKADSSACIDEDTSDLSSSDSS